MTGSHVTRPSPDLPDELRFALVVATARYTDPALRQLRAPARDADQLSEVLADPRIGGFAVTRVVDRTAQEIRLAAEEFLTGRDPEDLLLVYLSCHGLVDVRRKLYFAATDTVKTRLAATGVESQWLLDLMEDCRARRLVVILDCCFSGAFSHGLKGDEDLALGERLRGQGRGRVVLTASRGSEYSWEGEPLSGTEPPGSVFTTAIVDGIRSGAADEDHDGYVSVDDAYAFAFDRIRSGGGRQTPQRWLYGAEGKILLARSPAGVAVAPAALPEALRSGLDSPHPAIRLGAVTALGEWLTGPDPARELTARRTLKEVADADVPLVASAARALLAQAEPKAGERPTQPSKAGPDGPGAPPSRAGPSKVGSDGPGVPASRAEPGVPASKARPDEARPSPPKVERTPGGARLSPPGFRPEPGGRPEQPSKAEPVEARPAEACPSRPRPSPGPAASPQRVLAAEPARPESRPEPAGRAAGQPAVPPAARARPPAAPAAPAAPGAPAVPVAPRPEAPAHRTAPRPPPALAVPSPEVRARAVPPPPPVRDVEEFGSLAQDLVSPSAGSSSPPWSSRPPGSSSPPGPPPPSGPGAPSGPGTPPGPGAPSGPGAAPGPGGPLAGAPPGPRIRLLPRGRKVRALLLGVLLLVVAAVATVTVTSRPGPPAARTAAGATPNAGAVPAVSTDPALAALVPAAVRSSGRLVVATDPAYAPNEFKDDKGVIVGMDADLAKAIARKLGLTADLEAVNFDGIAHGVMSGAYQLGMSSIDDRRNREGYVDMVDYFTAGTAVAVRAGNPDGIDPNDLCGRSVAVRTGSTQAGEITGTRDPACTTAGKPGIRNGGDPYGAQKDATAAVVSGRDQALLGPSDVVDYAVSTADGQLTKVGSTYGSIPYGIAVARGSTLTQAVRGAVQELIDDGNYGRILTSWGVQAGAVGQASVDGATS
ncbi:transporter substrate-binding domain-containing protein [Kitasatospora sp. NPDC059722]|uniref:caspase, EACC1-associated type n=1 Tax=Kitasatospora sp. NPDC059722 TaxID=3346925 RepID=UPI00368995A4